MPKDGENVETRGTDRGERRSEDSQSEIQSIMDQFADETKGPKQEDIMSPRLELAEQFFVGPAHFPPRKSSLEPLKNSDSVSRAAHHAAVQPFSPPTAPPKPSPKAVINDSPINSRALVSMTAPPPPEPEPDQPFRLSSLSRAIAPSHR